MLDKAIRLLVSLTIATLIGQWFISLLVQALAQLFRGLGAAFSWAAHALLLIAVLIFAAGLAVRAGRRVSRAWRRGVGEESRRVSVRRRAEVEERHQPQAPPTDEADPPLMEEE